MAASNLVGASTTELWQALSVGMRFDARMAALLTLPLGVALAVPPFARRLRFRPVFFVYLLPMLVVVVLHAADIGFYQYKIF